MNKCDFCGSLFGENICYFCDKVCCTSCMIDDKTRCKECYINKRRLSIKKLIKKNKLILVFIGFLWLYAVFPGPFIPGLDPTFYSITLIAAILIMIPICLALFFWSLNPPKSDLKKK
jgi:hypothetical protein